MVSVLDMEPSSGDLWGELNHEDQPRTSSARSVAARVKCELWRALAARTSRQGE